MEEEEFDNLVNASRLYGEEEAINGSFRYSGETVKANSSELGYAIYTGIDQGPVETLDQVNAYFPIRGNIEVMFGDQYQEGAFREVNAHSYNTYDTDEWNAVKFTNDDFGFWWNRLENNHFNREHQVAFFSNAEEYDFSTSSTAPLAVVLPEMKDGFDSDLTDELQAFALMKPGNFELRE